MFDVNEYFEGKVKSIAFHAGDLPATIGVMGPGEYEFATRQKETMSVVSGTLTVKLPGENDWISFNQGDIFVIDANETFQVKIDAECAYMCTYE